MVSSIKVYANDKRKAKRIAASIMKKLDSLPRIDWQLGRRFIISCNGEVLQKDRCLVELSYSNEGGDHGESMLAIGHVCAAVAKELKLEIRIEKNCVVIPD